MHSAELFFFPFPLMSQRILKFRDFKRGRRSNKRKKNDNRVVGYSHRNSRQNPGDPLAPVTRNLVDYTGSGKDTRTRQPAPSTQEVSKGKQGRLMHVSSSAV